MTLVSLSKTLSHCFVLRMGRKALVRMCCVTPVKEPSALIKNRRGSPWCSWLWLLYMYAPQHLVNHYKLLNNWVSESSSAITFLKVCTLYILSALTTLFGRHVRYIRLQYYYYINITVVTGAPLNSPSGIFCSNSLKKQGLGCGGHPALRAIIQQWNYTLK